MYSPRKNFQLAYKRKNKTDIMKYTLNKLGSNSVF